MVSDNILQRELSQGERVLWQGRPGGGLRLLPMDWLLIPGGLLGIWLTVSINPIGVGVFGCRDSDISVQLLDSYGVAADDFWRC